MSELNSYDIEKNNLKYLLFISLKNKFASFWSKTSHCTVGDTYDV